MMMVMIYMVGSMVMLFIPLIMSRSTMIMVLVSALGGGLLVFIMMVVVVFHLRRLMCEYLALNMTVSISETSNKGMNVCKTLASMMAYLSLGLLC
jgi:hypothetical protein